MTTESQPERQSPSLGDMLESIPQHVTPEQVRGINAVVQINSTGAESGEWVITVRDSACSVAREKADSPDVTITAKSDVWQSLLQRKLDPAWAYMSGQLQVSGDLGLVMRLQSLISLG